MGLGADGAGRAARNDRRVACANQDSGFQVAGCRLARRVRSAVMATASVWSFMR